MTEPSSVPIVADERTTEIIASLTPKQLAWWTAYQETGNASEAYRRAYPNAKNWDSTTVQRQAHNLMRTSKIAGLISHRATVQASQLTLDQKSVVTHWVEIATADPSRVVKTRRVNCRHCYGIGFAYRWRNTDEWALAYAEALDRNTERQRKRDKGKDGVPPDEPLPTLDGGVGWRRPDKPNPDCPHCDGEGKPDVFVADMDMLTGPERRLIAGVKQTKDGLEVKLRDQDRALENIAKVLTMFGERREISGPGGGPVPVAAVHALMPVDPVQASRAYADLIEGKTAALPAPQEPSE